ncbi:hypothetical protein GQ55_8G202000 [Panicum hallii var. hallii]|uniref:Pectin acetylesterase n=1 Tax=Panicum hallii var. hallii TaxID=1504633 RepID=A0A2T7CPB2_9POAL|nr:hypothetical protein GQ55_8G202000 [Panicum hallii var. hallii]
MSFKRKNLVVAGLTLQALLVASFYELPGVAMASSYSGGRGLCDVSTGTECTSDATCRAGHLQAEGQRRLLRRRLRTAPRRIVPCRPDACANSCAAATTGRRRRRSLGDDERPPEKPATTTTPGWQGMRIPNGLYMRGS